MTSAAPDLNPITIRLDRFLTVETCPPQWYVYDLYIIRDDRVTFYVGQSQCAFKRVWEHLKGGIHGHAIVGRFILVNWPRSSRFWVELHASQSARFAPQAFNLDSAERALIEALTPCYNVSLNHQPSPLPEDYLPANAPIKRIKNFRRMLREAAISAKRHDSEIDTKW